ncbi:TetR/AcrR family transcriptional regulator [Parapedobacter koreensis]|uniref:Transcriptional regulator, TetR family n=1 Tax=Parapedobacter koreensis TaxID=332977 RepID=A0A1H7M7I9_9SPHI|nr:TetR/AcrR family transcriptional regulator [Parapedobacter koreensis]SEL07164.1 transcriptional regulator, TetR family [Parapedobacter koreensis]
MNVQLEHTAEKKSAIFESTLRLVMKQGFHGSPMSQIAQEAGVATGTIYHYFSSKDELIIELFKHCKYKIGNAMFKIAEGHLPYPARFVAVWTNLVHFYIQYPEVLSFMEQFFSSPYAEAVYERGCSVQMQNEMFNFLQQGIDDSHIKPLDINILSAAFIGTVTATAKRHINGHYSFDETSMNEMVAIIWDGIKK